ncbi:MAG: Hsp33 family molecular chaperone HslO [Christensenellales bacterium]
MLRLTLMGGQARVFICDTTEMAQQARDIHNASNTCSAAMGRMLAATAIMGANLKSEGDRITATINGGGPAGPILRDCRAGWHGEGYHRAPGSRIAA